MKLHLFDYVYLLILILGFSLAVLPTLLTSKNLLFNLSISNGLIQVLTAIGIVLIILNVIIFLFIILFDHHKNS